MLFWIIACLIAALVAASLLQPLLWPADPAPAESRDIGVYRDQLAEVERDLARGLLDADAAARTRSEVSRRLLSADKAGVNAMLQVDPRRANRILAGVLLLGLTVGALVIYNWLGAPGYPDIAQASRIAAGDALREGRISQSQAEALVPVVLAADVPAADMALIAQLRVAVQDHPDQVQGWAFLADYESRIRNYSAAARAQEQVITLRADAASVADHEMLVDLQVAAAGGFVSPEVELTLRRLLAADPENLTARYYTGLLYAQTDRPDIAFRLWRDLVAAGGDEIHVQLARAQVADAAFRAGVEYEVPPEAGPTAADIAAAQDLSPEDQQAMIRGMVEQLSDRLATQGGPPGDWARLISSLGVLGETDQARAIWTEAQVVFADDPTALAQLIDAATSAGITP